MPLLRSLLRRFFWTSTPRGFIVLPLLSCPEYGPPSNMVMFEGAEGGDGGRPTSSESHETFSY